MFVGLPIQFWAAMALVTAVAVGMNVVCWAIPPKASEKSEA